jgi:Fe2+ or Zn2+ uptake regulation protein
VLEAADGHLSAAELHRRVVTTRPFTNLSTVYRTVERLTELGLVHTVNGPGEASFGLAVHDHHHAVCEGCGRVLQIDARALTALGAWAQSAVGLDVRSVELRGSSGDCHHRPPAAHGVSKG